MSFDYTQKQMYRGLRLKAPKHVQKYQTLLQIARLHISGYSRINTIYGNYIKQNTTVW